MGLPLVFSSWISYRTSAHGTNAIWRRYKLLLKQVYITLLFFLFLHRGEKNPWGTVSHCLPSPRAVCVCFDFVFSLTQGMQRGCLSELVLGPHPDHGWSWQMWRNSLNSVTFWIGHNKYVLFFQFLSWTLDPCELASGCDVQGAKVANVLLHIWDEGCHFFLLPGWVLQSCVSFPIISCLSRIKVRLQEHPSSPALSFAAQCPSGKLTAALPIAVTPVCASWRRSFILQTWRRCRVAAQDLSGIKIAF